LWGPDAVFKGRQIATRMLAGAEFSKNRWSNLWGEVRRMTKRGDSYLRTLLIQGARSTLLAANLAQKRGAPLDRTQEWALALTERAGHNKAAVTPANKNVRRLCGAA
jgi:transposase